MTEDKSSVEPWKNLEPGEPISGPAVVFAAWFVGLLLTGAVGIGIVFLIAGAEGKVTPGALAMAFAAMATGSAVVAGLLQPSFKDWRKRSLFLSLFGIFLPAVLCVVITVKQSGLMVVLPGLVGTVFGIFGIGLLIDRLRKRSE